MSVSIFREYSVWFSLEKQQKVWVCTERCDNHTHMFWLSPCLQIALCLFFVSLVPKPDINNIQGVNLQAAEGSFVDLKCNASSRSDVMTAGIHWGNKGEDITSLSSGVWTQGKITISRLRVNFTTAKDILLISDCSRQNEASRTVKCDNTFICVAFYSSLALRLEPAYETAVVTVQLRKLTFNVWWKWYLISYHGVLQNLKC